MTRKSKRLLTLALVGVGGYFAWTKFIQPMLAAQAGGGGGGALPAPGTGGPSGGGISSCNNLSGLGAPAWRRHQLRQQAWLRQRRRWAGGGGGGGYGQGAACYGGGGCYGGGWPAGGYGQCSTAMLPGMQCGSAVVNMCDPSESYVAQ